MLNARAPNMERLIVMSMPAAMAAEVAVRRRAWEAELESRRQGVRDAIKLYCRTPNSFHQRDALAAIRACCFVVESEPRLLTALALIELAPPTIFWPALTNVWSSCDATMGP